MYPGTLFTKYSRSADIYLIRDLKDPQDIVGESPLDEIFKELAQAIKDFKNPSSLIFEECSSSTEVPDVVATTNHADSNTFLAYKVHLEGMRMRVMSINVQQEHDLTRRQECLRLVEQELTRLRDLKLQLWSLCQSEEFVRKTFHSVPANSVRVYNTSE